MEEKDILQHHGDIAAQKVEVQRLHLVPANADRAVLGVVKARNEVGHRGFSRTGRAHQGNHGPGRNGDVDIVENRPVRLIAERDVLELHVPGHPVRPHAVGRADNIGLEVEQFKHPLRADRGFLERVVDIGELQKGLIDLGQIHNKHKQVSRTHPTAERHDAPQECDQHHPDAAGDFYHTDRNEGQGTGPQHIVP